MNPFRQNDQPDQPTGCPVSGPGTDYNYTGIHPPVSLRPSSGFAPVPTAPGAPQSVPTTPPAQIITTPPTPSSHYVFGGNHINGHSYIRAADACPRSRLAVPQPFGNYPQSDSRPELPIPFERPYQHVPLYPNQSTPYQPGEAPRTLRAIYQDGDRSNMIVARHIGMRGLQDAEMASLWSANTIQGSPALKEWLCAREGKLDKLDLWEGGG
ncbi:hypothetical protein SAPIO_CDS5522 [Scedosporium apiospermum]|uniref:Uncharacterized protein n=1 Tax=Pseudallescheria apiosperma TaxID=563466 RepID=A0A084G4T7_PSEDA|nr:uncharacterized protein SAPIO_CDS5522 [Scedosporium apiospermum]KEZ42349.1 hypothetical protein SAPIO_CDS5522 [Scedosporium apiospermum]